MSPSMDTPWSVVGDQYRASQSPRPLSTGRSGHNAGEVSGAAAFRPGSPSRPACTSPATVAAGTEAGIGLLAASVSARSPRFAPEHPLSVILANQARDAALYGDADRINAMREA